MKKFMSTKMKIFLSVLTSISLFCYIAAAIVLYNSDFKLSNYINDFNGDWHIGWGNFNSVGNLEKNLPNTIQNINIQSTSADIDVQFQNNDKISMEISGNFYDGYDFNDGIQKFDISNDTVNIESNDGRLSRSLSLKIYIPTSYKGNLTINSHSGGLNLSGGELPNANIKSLSGDISLYNLIADNINVNSTSGSINLSDIKSRISNISSSSGDIEIVGSLGESKVNSSSGEISLSLNGLGKNSNFSSTSGDIALNLNSNLGYKVLFNSTSGNLKGSNLNLSIDDKNSYSLSNGDGSNTINVNTTSGDLEINH